MLIPTFSALPQVCPLMNQVVVSFVWHFQHNPQFWHEARIVFTHTAAWKQHMADCHSNQAQITSWIKRVGTPPMTFQRPKVKKLPPRFIGLFTIDKNINLLAMKLNLRTMEWFLCWVCWTSVQRLEHVFDIKRQHNTGWQHNTG